MRCKCRNDCSQKLIPLIDEKVAKIFGYFLENVSDVCCTNFSHNHKLNAVNSKIIGNKRAKFSIQRYKMQRSSCILFVAFFVFFLFTFALSKSMALISEPWKYFTRVCWRLSKPSNSKSGSALKFKVNSNAWSMGY